MKPRLKYLLALLTLPMLLAGCDRKTQSTGEILMDTAAKLCGEEGEFAIITGTLTAGNLNTWRGFIEARLAAKYPRMKLVATKPSDDDKGKAQQEAANLISAYPGLKCI